MDLTDVFERRGLKPLIPLNRERLILVGAIYTAVMAVLVDWVLGKVEERLVAPTARPA